MHKNDVILGAGSELSRPVDDLFDVACQIVVCQHDAFREPGGAAGVRQDHQVRHRVNIDGRWAGRGALDESPEGRGIAGALFDDNHSLQRGDVAFCRLRHLQQRAVNYEHLGPAVIELMGYLPFSIAGVKGAGDGACLHDAEERYLELRAVGRQQADSVCRSDTNAGQRGSKLVGVGLQLLECKGTFAVNDGNLIGKPVRRLPQNVLQWVRLVRRQRWAHRVRYGHYLDLLRSIVNVFGMPMSCLLARA